MDEEARNLCRKQDLKDLPGERVWGELRRLLAGEYVDKGWTLLRELGLLEQLFPGLEGLHNVEIESHMGLICQSGCTLDEPGLMAVQLTLATLAVSEAEVALVFKRLRLDRVGGVSLQRAVRGLRAWTQEVQHQDLRDEAILRLSEEWPVQWGGAIYAALHGGDGLEDVMRRAVALGVAQGPLPVLLTGEELLRRGVDAGPKVGHLLKEARELQLRGHLTTSGEALKWLEQELSRD
jgi:tRNA nucleotidyltransferase/poly(A) polymerase